MSKFTDWYTINGENLNIRRREKYHLDEVYREKIIHLNNEYKNSFKKDTSKLSLEENNQKYTAQLFTINDLCTLIGCSTQLIAKWEDINLIPKTPFRDSRNRRFYTKELIKIIFTVLNFKGKIKE